MWHGRSASEFQVVPFCCHHGGTELDGPGSCDSEVESWFVIDLRAVWHLLILGGMAVILFGIPIGPYALLTMDQRRAARNIRRGAVERGWRYRSRSGGFRIEGTIPAGSTLSGVMWVMTSGNTGSGEMRRGLGTRFALPGSRWRHRCFYPASRRKPFANDCSVIRLLRSASVSGVARWRTPCDFCGSCMKRGAALRTSTRLTK
jgi:hypothetical protein